MATVCGRDRDEDHHWLAARVHTVGWVTGPNAEALPDEGYPPNQAHDRLSEASLCQVPC